MLEENISKKLCKKCEKELNIEDSIFNGYCEKCYNKWLNTKNKNYKQSTGHNNFSFFSTLSCLFGILSIGLIALMFVLFIINFPILFVNFITFFQITDFVSSCEEFFYIISKLIYISIFFEIIGVLLGILCVKKYGKNSTSITGITLCIISAIFPLCTWLILIVLT